MRREIEMSTNQTPSINDLDPDGLAEMEARDWLAPQGEKLFDILAAYQGEEFKHAKELTKGQQVIDTHYGSPRVCTVIKTHKMSVRLRYIYPNGMVSEYGCPVHHLRRVV
jgi:hypothetical protein